jgi:bacterioferritin
MKAPDAKIIDHLNQVLKNELTAINQYFLHAKMLADWGLGQLATKVSEESVDEMKHADTLIERILFLAGLPILQELGKLLVGQNVKEILECDLKLEELAVPDLRVAIKGCEAAGDYVSREIFQRILDAEEEHIDWLETQLGLLEKIGEANYLQAQMGGAA